VLHPGHPSKSIVGVLAGYCHGKNARIQQLGNNYLQAKDLRGPLLPQRKPPKFVIAGGNQR
jgi:hypothetical protein